MMIEARIARVEAAVRQFAAPGARPAPRGPLSRNMADGGIPLELAALYQIADGLILDEVDVWDLEDTLDFAGRAEIAREYPGAVAFGWNRSNLVYILDAADSMHCGAGAILSVDSVYSGPESAVFCAADLGSFLLAAHEGALAQRRVKVVDVQAIALARAIAAHPDRVDARLPLPEPDRDRIIGTREIVPGVGLLAYLGIADGLRFARTGLQIAGAADLAAVPAVRRSDGAPAAIRIGRAESGEELVVTAPGWLRPSDLVLQLRPGGDLLSAPSFGRLLPVLTGWITSDAENAP